jgi:hypothetical protein
MTSVVTPAPGTRAPQLFGGTSLVASQVRYGAFISYSHSASAEVARGLQKWLQTYAKPWWRWRAVNVFRDETDLTAAPALWSRITRALDQSSHFILLASPEAAQSKWIKREIRYWLGDHKAGLLDGPHLDAPIANPKPERVATLLIALTVGDISWDDKAGSADDFDWNKTNAVPRLLSGVFREEPQWVDLRTVVQREHLRSSLSRSNSEFMRAVAQLAAPIRGIPDFSRLVSEDYRQHRRTIRTAWTAAAVLAGVSAAAVWQWRDAVAERAEAQANAEQARANAAEAEANAKRAEANLHQAQITQRRLIAGLAGQKRASDVGTAVLLALDALTDATARTVDYVPEAQFQLDGSLRGLRERLVLGHDAKVLGAAFRPDGKSIVTVSASNTWRVWDAESGQLIGNPVRGAGGEVFTAVFSADGTRIVTTPWNGTAQIWDTATGQPVGQPLDGGKRIFSVVAGT